MSNSILSQPLRRTLPSVQHVRSPLTRVAYGLNRESAHLVLLVAGEMDLRKRAVVTASGIRAPRLVWQRTADAEEFVFQAGSRAHIVAVPDLALIRMLPTTLIGEQMLRTLARNLSFQTDRLDRLTALAESLDEEKRGDEPGSDVAVEHCLGLVLLQVWRLARADMTEQGYAPQGIAERFVLLAGQHAREHWDVGDYARSLGVSRDRLGSAVRRATGLSPQAYLHRAIISEACDLLAGTGMPLGQIAFRLGFKDQAYFSRFFSRMMTTSPARYRRSARPSGHVDDRSYAAWP